MVKMLILRNETMEKDFYFFSLYFFLFWFQDFVSLCNNNKRKKGHFVEDW